MNSSPPAAATRSRRRTGPHRPAAVSRRVVAAAVPRGAAAGAAAPPPRAADRAVFPHGQDEILAATRLESAGGGQEGAQELLVAADAGDQPRGRQPAQPADHGSPFSRSFASFFATC